MVARLMQLFWHSSTLPNECKALAAEIRQLLSQCGLTPMSRQALQWEIERGEGAAQSTAQRRAAKKAAAKKASAKPDPRVARANLHVV